MASALTSRALLRRALPSARRPFVTNMTYNMAKKMMPKISETERVALGCGTVGFDADIFTGSPSLQKLIDTYDPKLSAEEQAFLDKEVDELCAMLDDYSIVQNADLPPEAWDYMRREGFFSMKIPKEWGGKGFSTAAVSAVLAKLGTKSSDANATVAVPNSLGPGELLARYGTPEQQQYFLPRLASGQLVPCFGLTGPHSGSDATSLIGSYGVVEERNGELGVVATFRKRYITLAPVAGVVGIGLDLQDPNGLLKGSGAEGFTVALLERDHEGLRMGPRHVPLTSAFMNGTVEGDDVWIPMSSILGGQEKCGEGWRMFVECLAEGRGVSLPAGSVAATRLLATSVGAYTRVRKQFKVPIAEFGGIQEALARIGSQGLICVAGADLMNAIVDNHEAPMVISSIMKQSCTERGRRIVIDGMDILGGAGICRGPMNFAGNLYMSMPIAITVEGANIMTRSFQIMGQGITRCHPHMVPLVESLSSDAPDAPVKFRTELFNMAGHGIKNFALSISRGLQSTVATAMRSKTAYKDGKSMVAYHENQMLRLSANLAYAADLALVLGGRLKFEELLLGRLSDAIGAIYLGHAVLWHYEKRKGIEGLEAATEHAMLSLEYEAQVALRDAANNFPEPFGSLVGSLMNVGCAPLGDLSRSYRPAGDALTKEVSNLLTKPSQLREMFAENIFVSDQPGDRVATLLEALPVVVEADSIASALRKEKREATASEQEVLDRANALRDELVQVDVYDRHGVLEADPTYVRSAITQTEQWGDSQDDEPKSAIA
uniref:Acyl-coenzyme A dehydrogenase n=2 Tax=Rhizochromulina marina TaxID=1034831 RepID=A0A7S2SRH0_9STRA|mmetsp:Transcript_4316/g.12856  ORF Transcript_4316/g.12856 Transcript_4316/m.12856 type:complete len:776 (+) Transcript_4316:58-2385(+)